MTPDQRAKLDAARKSWRSDPRHQSTCTHQNATGGGSLIETLPDGSEVYADSWTCQSCGVSMKEVVKYTPDGKGGVRRVVLSSERAA